MKKKISMAVVCCLALCAYVLTSCNSDVTGDQIYTIGVSESTSTGSYMSYKASGAEKKICDAVGEIASPVGDDGTTYTLNGKRKKMDKKIQSAVNKAMDEIEADSSYCALFDISACTVEVKRLGDGGEVVLSRKFKDKE